MPRTLKRRADAISRNEESSSEAPSDSPPQRPRSTQQQQQTQSTQRCQHRRSTPPSNVSRSDASDNDDDDGHDPAVDSQTQSKTMIKKLVRLALSSEYARVPLRRTDINTKILKSDTGTSSTRVNFRAVFLGAQDILRDVFGIELVDLPSRERVGLADRRKAASQKATQKEQATQRARMRDQDTAMDVDGDTQTGRKKDPVLSAQNWVLVSCLPEAYRTRPGLLVPSRAPDEGVESAYVALYTMIVSLMYLHTPSGVSDAKQESQGQLLEDATEPISDAKLHRFLSRLNLTEWTPVGVEGANIDKLLARMMREGYIEKRRDTTGGEEVIEWVVGPRGKREVGRKGVAGFVRGVYGFGIDGSGKGLEMPLPDGEEQEQEEEGGGEGRRQQRRRPVKMEKDELESRLKRTLGDVVALKVQDQGRNTEPVAEEEGELNGGPGASSSRHGELDERRAPRRSGRRRNNQEDDDNDDDDDDDDD